MTLNASPSPMRMGHIYQTLAESRYFLHNLVHTPHFFVVLCQPVTHRDLFVVYMVYIYDLPADGLIHVLCRDLNRVDVR
ncbi:hypothetical protein AG1IA_02900 [Rhizoctonia solani AG-1 IA]|uniref:Uncharacterized protein n=1 Tax=Thanatephorus cucumeris (strain AG1-IA) TaxID=983506 RepID=L8WYI1_THACA|nr:hypothetical protein AG1IA_02900 [Rhizoctonia solani AG-1 IA]